MEAGLRASQMALATRFPVEKSKSRISGVNVCTSSRRERTFDRWDPRERCTPAHSMQSKHPKFMEHQSGFGAEQSAQTVFASSTCHKFVNNSPVIFWCVASSWIDESMTELGFGIVFPNKHLAVPALEPARDLHLNGSNPGLSFILRDCLVDAEPALGTDQLEAKSSTTLIGNVCRITRILSPTGPDSAQCQTVGLVKSKRRFPCTSP